MDDPEARKIKVERGAADAKSFVEDYVEAWEHKADKKEAQADSDEEDKEYSRSHRFSGLPPSPALTPPPSTPTTVAIEAETPTRRGSALKFLDSMRPLVLSSEDVSKPFM